MAWSPLATIKPARQWRFTPPIAGAYFRLKHSSAPSTPRAWIAQAEKLEGNNYQLYNAIPLLAKSQVEILRLDSPPFFAERCLAVLQSDVAQNWSIQIEVNDFMPLTIGSTTVSMPTSSSATPSSVTASTTQGVLLAANSNRKGAMILNHGTGNLFLEFGEGGVSTSDYAVKLTPASYYEVPFTFTGKISGVWDATGGNALIRELT